MKRPETPPENLVGIQGDSLQITNMSKKLEEQTKKLNEKKIHTTIKLNGKQFPQRTYNPQMAKRRTDRCSSSMSNSRYVDVESSSTQSPSYIMNYEFPAFPSNALFKHKTMMPKSYFPRTVQERLPTRSEFNKIFQPKKLSKMDLLFIDSIPTTPQEKNTQSPKFSSQKRHRKNLLESNISQNNRSFRATI